MFLERVETSDIILYLILSTEQEVQLTSLQICQTGDDWSQIGIDIVKRMISWNSKLRRVHDPGDFFGSSRQRHRSKSKIWSLTGRKWTSLIDHQNWFSLPDWLGHDHILCLNKIRHNHCFSVKSSSYDKISSSGMTSSSTVSGNVICSMIGERENCLSTYSKVCFAMGYTTSSTFDSEISLLVEIQLLLDDVEEVSAFLQEEVHYL